MSAVKMLSVDLAELSLDRVDNEISTRLKSDEELDRLTVDPHLTGIERAVYLLRHNMKASHGEDRSVQTPVKIMRSGVLEPLEPLDRDNCLPLQAVIVRNGKIFVDNMDTLYDDVNDENKRLEEEIDRLTGGEDDDDYMESSKFSQEAFDSFMRANDSDDELAYTMTSTDPHQNSECVKAADEEVTFLRQSNVTYEYHSHDLPNVAGELLGYDCYSGQDYLGNGSQRTFSSAAPGVEMDIVSVPGGQQRPAHVDSFHGQPVLDDEVTRLLKEDFDTSWRYVPLYPEHYYSSGQEVQRVSVITDLPNLLRDNNAECMRRVVPKVREVLHVANIDMQLAAATAFLQILERKLVTVEEYKKTFLQTILTSVDSKNEEVANAWLETLLSCIDLLPKDVVEKDVLSIAVNKGQLCQTLQARLSCCKILGKVSSKFENFVVKNDVLPVVLSLCGDVEYDVRACMCQRLDVIAQGLGLELTKSKLLPQLIELSEDESQSVVCACLETTASIIGMLDREATVNAIVPMVKELLEKAIKNVDTTLPVASRLFGKLCHSLLEYMSVDDKAYFLEYFRKLCRTGLSDKKNKEDAIKLLDALDIFETASDANTETRQNAAYNFPAMVLFAEPKLFRLELYPCFSQLCKDPHLAVRKTMAVGFHEVAKLLGSNVGLVFPELNSLLMDPDIEILKAIIPNFQEIMSPLAAIGVDQFTEHRVHVVQDVLTHFLKAESVVFSSPCWRTQEAMMRSMESLYLLCTNEYIYNKVIPLLLEKLRTGRARPVKVAAAKTLTVLTRHLKYRGQREQVVQTLIDDFHRSESCYQRSLFIDLALCYLQTNSKQAFKDNFYNYILNMKSDRVATVRLKMLTIFPDMKRSLKLPRDQTLRTALDTVLRQIMVYDKDTDVQRAAQQMSEELTLIHEGSDNTRSNRRNLTEEEEEDLRKENEERDFLIREDQDRREDEAKTVKGNEKRNSIGGNKKDVQSKIPSSKKGGSGPLKVLPGGGSKGDGPHQLMTKKTSVSSITPVNITNKELTPETSPKKESVRRIPVLAHKTASMTSLTGGAVNKKSPVPGRKSQPTTPSALQSPVAAVSSSRRGSGSNFSTSAAAKPGSTSLASSSSSETTVKVKVLTPTKTSGATVGTPARLLKKPGK